MPRFLRISAILIAVCFAITFHACGKDFEATRLAAQQGDANAQFELGLMYFMGKVVPQNYVEAAKWYRLAAEQGHAKAQFNLGELYDLGLGVAQNYAEASKWYRSAKDPEFFAASKAAK